eukprot:CAMPEP_0197303938 /NCGR_PEP_ID=MMETSP0890-20130614/51965_1 /TAXON_ID=44058 ORGANISM="Aureoumbra lagunensis, Strain CCMP1510" /NCGR_SAMPLE_ID=MMETSP0890 /ASSEMBLY_ACC=CAM_ASM_000533 /LENGTH=30 /DNA_ID= /DNA_START= /DNA_END= /DNA_ORIENTATION=
MDIEANWVREQQLSMFDHLDTNDLVESKFL